ncbi:MAG: GAF domain-containing protein [Acidobacteriota bacterium]|nr:GAF domain-containing protein [Acidobacteriota bacterium]
MAEQHTVFASLFERMSDPALVIDAGGERLLALNPAFAELIGKTPESASSLALGDVLRPEMREGGEGNGDREGIAHVPSGQGDEWMPVLVERLPCQWNDLATTLCLVRRDDHAEQEKLHREMEGLIQREMMVAQIGRKLARSQDPATVLEEAVTTLGEALKADRCHILLYREDRSGDDGGKVLVEYEYLTNNCKPLRGQGWSVRESSYVQRVLEADEPIAIEDWSTLEPDVLTELYGSLSVRSVLSTPIEPGGSRRGLLELHHCTDTRVWTEEDRKLVATVAGQVSVALANAELREASRLRNEELRGLYEISRAFSTMTDTADISGRLTLAIANLVGGEMCLIATYDRRRNTVRAEAPGYNTPRNLLRAFNFKLDEDDRYTRIFRSGEAFLSNDPAGGDHDINRDFTERYGIRSVMVVPLRLMRELIGFICVANRAGGFRDRDLNLLEIFAAQVAETIVNARLFVTIQAQAEREAIINRLLLSLQSGGEPELKIHSLIERIGEVLQLDRCIAELFDDDSNDDFYGEWCAENVTPMADWQAVMQNSPIRDALRTHRRPLMTNDVRTHPLAVGLEELIGKTTLQSILIAPIMRQGRVIGSLSGHQTRRQRHWSEDDIDLLMAVATHAGSTLENARLISELRTANRTKDEFLATLSHELRTPLTAITGWVDLLSESPLLKSHEDFAEGVEAISISATSLAQLISDLLDLSRIQRNVLRLERVVCDANQAVMNAVRTVRHSAVARRQELHLDLAEDVPQIYFDAQRIQQVLWNLLTNSIKFTPQGGRITVRSRYVEDSPGTDADGARECRRWLVINVSDTGEGIPESFIPYIWDRFRQADSSVTRRHGGLGIGLALVKELVEAHGGRVGVVSDDQGTTFTVRLPIGEADEVEADTDGRRAKVVKLDADYR